MLPPTHATLHNRARISTSIEKTNWYASSQVQRRPFWFRPLIGYLLSGPFVGISLLVLKAEAFLLPNFPLPGGPLYVAVALIAFIAGLGPALFTIILSVITLNYFFLPPAYGFTTWIGVGQLLRFVVVGLLLTLIIVQRDAALRRATTAHDEWHKRANQMEAVFEAMTDAVIVYDSNGMIVEANTLGRQLWHRVALDSLKQEHGSQRSDQMAIYDGTGQLLSEEQLPQRRILQGETLAGLHAVDVSFIIKDGHVLYARVTGSPLHDQQGIVVGAVCVYRDTTEQRHLEQRMQLTLSTLLAMAENLVGEGTTEAKPLSAVNAAHEVIIRLATLTQRALGFQHVSIIQADGTGVFQPVVFIGFSAEQEQHIRHAALEFRASDVYMRAIAQLGKDNVVFLDTTRPPFQGLYDVGVKRPLHIPMVLGEQLVGILALNHGESDHDYTPAEIALAKATARFIALVIDRQRLVREQTEARANELSLREAQRRMEAFLGIASHELRTPLTSVKGSIQLADLQLSKQLSRPARSSEEMTVALAALRNLFQRADQQAERLNRIVNDLVDVSRIQANNLRLRPVMCDLAILVGEVVNEHRQIVSGRLIDLHLPAEPVRVYADADRVGQVVTNYLSNALKYSAPEMVVTVRLAVEGSTARVEVCDDGPGLSPQEQVRIWERFYQAPGMVVQSGSSVGLGIGLHICYTIITQHHGGIGVQSTPGQGSTFWFTLPLSEEAVGASPLRE